MATVKFSGELRERIVNTAKARFATQLNTAKESHPRDWGDRLYNLIFGHYEDLTKQLPAYWLHHEDSIDVNAIDGGVHVGLSFPLNPVRPYPASMPTDRDCGLLAWKRGSYGSEIILKDAPEFAEFKAEVIAWKKRVAFVENQQREFAQSVQHVINSYVTLAPALKAWPPLWELIPEDVKEKHKKIVERERKEVELGVDLDRMTALASYTKIRGQ